MCHHGVVVYDGTFWGRLSKHNSATLMERGRALLLLRGNGPSHPPPREQQQVPMEQNREPDTIVAAKDEYHPHTQTDQHGSWVGNTWIPPADSKTYLAELRTFYQDKLVLWFEDSAARRESWTRVASNDRMRLVGYVPVWWMVSSTLAGSSLNGPLSKKP